ncbi:trans-aconitate 2-methyltransferase [Pirellula sp. SH-Sr6A]|uniref:class I SAM-dependent methyltransferase n=1 Tax=Pirellula sp. SH-Sr6A TaxID=1632865 RepID=UPI00078E2F16|nr:class I SAM-dependent methyltransferase [Pirellula sp. SH-Sr6A]AMV34703.1 trans-aconitate 2-methyltransferase [Pirellula sp. SH-Sr6A]
MASNHQPAPPSFDSYAAEYEAALAKGVSLSGESSDFFASTRIEITRHTLRRIGFTPTFAMDFGCGIGNSVPYLLETLQCQRVIGVDPSQASLQIAAQKLTDERVQWCVPEDWRWDDRADLAFCNGVFHHIPPDHRLDAFRWIHERLVEGGCFAYWENNPWNPGTRWVMSRIPFDRDAICLSILESKRLIEQAGFRVRVSRSAFYFPRILKGLRVLEPWLSRFPLGAQYWILATKPSNGRP